MSGTCKGCGHWGNTNAWLPSPGLVVGHRRCVRLTEQSLADALILMEDVDGNPLCDEVTTHPDFGCVLFEVRGGS